MCRHKKVICCKVYRSLNCNTLSVGEGTESEREREREREEEEEEDMAARNPQD